MSLPCVPRAGKPVDATGRVLNALVIVGPPHSRRESPACPLGSPMELWIPITVTAALAQTWRTAMQQKLRGLLSVNGAGFVRFVYGVPTGMVLLLAGLYLTGLPLPYPTPHFLLWCALGGLFQIVATNLLIMAFGFRGFAVGTAYAKTEAAQSAIIALIVLGEALHLVSWIGIVLGLAGVMTLSLAGRGLKAGEFLAATVQPAAIWRAPPPSR